MPDRNTRLSRAVAAARAGGSSAAAQAEFAAATAGMTQRQRAAFALKRRADEGRITQLRGVFAAFDEDRDGVLSAERELPVALLALGVEPSAKALQQLTLAAPSGRVDLATVSPATRAMRAAAARARPGSARLGPLPAATKARPAH
jgi:hypothetical protein